MFRYTCERSNIQKTTGSDNCRKNNLSELALPLYVIVIDKLLKKCSHLGTPINYGKTVYQVNITFSFNKSILPLHTGRFGINTLTN
jgi:hypothetical protein